MKVTVSAKQPDLSTFVGPVYRGEDFADLSDQKNVILTPTDMNEWPYARIRSMALDDHILLFQNSMIRSVTDLNIYILAPQSFINAIIMDPNYIPISTLQIQ